MGTPAAATRSAARQVANATPTGIASNARGLSFAAVPNAACQEASVADVPRATIRRACPPVSASSAASPRTTVTRESARARAARRSAARCAASGVSIAPRALTAVSIPERRTWESASAVRKAAIAAGARVLTRRSPAARESRVPNRRRTARKREPAARRSSSLCWTTVPESAARPAPSRRPQGTAVPPGKSPVEMTPTERRSA